MTASSKPGDDYPLVTVLLSSYNRPRLIRDAIDSILAQTWPNIELIVADDWSDPPALDAICERLGFNDKLDGWDYVRPLQQPTPRDRQFGQRVSVCINAAMPYVKGDFVCFLPDDDLLFRNAIETRTRYLIMHPEVHVVYGRLRACKSWTPVLGMHFDATRGCVHDDDSFYSATPIARAANRVDHGMLMVRRRPGEFDPGGLPAWPEWKTACVRPEQDDEGGWRNDDWIETRYEPPFDTRPVVAQFDCPDSGFLFRLELAGLGPFHSVPDCVVLKRYHAFGHRTDPNRRE